MLPLALLVPLAMASTEGASAAIPTGDRDGSEMTDFDGPPAHRSGIAFGLTLGAGLGSASGYPNNSEEIGNPEDYSASGVMLGSNFAVLAMGALSDYLNFGFWFGSASFRSADWRSTSGGGGLRVEVFPLTRLYPTLGGLGVLAQFGLASGRLTSIVPGRLEASGTQSFAATGAFYEWSVGGLFGGHFGLGPSVEYDAMWSQPFERDGLVVSARAIFYGGP